MDLTTLPSYIKKFDFNEIDSSPTAPGVYAWYAKLQVGLADWRENYDESGKNDLGEMNLRRLLMFHSNRFDPPEYEIKAKSSFELEWSGKLSPQLAFSFDKYLSSNKEEDWNIDNKKKLDDVKKIQKPFKTEKTRSFMIKILEESCPFFTSPIYIGKSENINRRLKEHANDIKNYSRALSAEPEKRNLLVEHIKNSESKFAARVVALGFAPEQLQVFTFDLNSFTNGKCSIEDLDALACTVEWLLNRWHRPIAGRI